ncbi:transcriptional regulator, HxlR family [Serratia sp. AS12]|uniref:winged helix-turn-helix transcriptional regulator n=1 Tax=Serratia TaxID=613 RepID=UPI00020E9B37|nr:MULTISPECIES: helix-turn-helix domain-containing protein [Serratia]AEF47353.1 transcriptional regulator, HxlR family [Serratia plymuthica AS9]AEF52305.1 transcriptional regulator, HxlR family [Serratia sp. AS12]AEG30012.1 transcriptional regulator, HxlR family [Serratia sp. AS13]MBJ7893652.1 helix-turn-helix transcriptional regulator [Serratia sp. PAMC26656]UTN96025.1 helix-turn-helix transcriptional regulator [Serratia plymuthica]
MDLRGPFSIACPTRELLDQLADKWSMLVLMAVREHPVRFNALKRAIEGISQKVLTHTLRKLECNGLVTRTVFAAVPVKVEYSITPLGESLVILLAPLREWAIENLPHVEQARKLAAASRQPSDIPSED